MFQEDLTQEEELELQDLVEESSTDKYEWGEDYESTILSMLLCDNTFLIQSLNLIKPEYFSEEIHEQIYRSLTSHFNKYGNLPTLAVLSNKIREETKDKKKATFFCSELEFLSKNYIPGLVSRNQCLDKVLEFAKEQAIKLAVARTLKIVKNKKDDGRWAKIGELFSEALRISPELNLGLNYFETLEERYNRLIESEKTKECFETGFPSIDEALGGGLGRGEVAAYLAASGVGKSLLLVRTAVKSVLRGRKVLYISLEMSQDKLAKRFDAQFALHNIKTLTQNKDIVINSIKDVVKDDISKSKLWIKQYPAGTCTIETIQAYLAQAELHGFIPDLICIDYVGEFQDIPEMKLHESRQIIVRNIRRVAVEKNVSIFTAIQANRGSKTIQQTGVISDEYIGDSFGQIRIFDGCWSICESDTEKLCGVARIFVVKHRDGASGFTIYVKRNKETLDISEISKETYGNLMSQQYVVKNTDAEIEKVIGKKFKPNGF